MNAKKILTTTFSIILIAFLVFATLLAAGPAQVAQAADVQQEEATPTAPVQPTPESFERPLIVIQAYSSGVEAISAGQSFNLFVLLVNNGQKTAENVVATFTPGDLVPGGTGGVISVGQIHPNNRSEVNQPLTATFEIFGKRLATQVMTITYTDWLGNAYNESFNLTFPVFTPSGSGKTATPTPTPTAVPLVRPQLVITDYNSNVETIQPGSIFDLDLEVRNVGNARARRVTMIVGGGTASGGGDEGTPVPGGVSGSGGEFTNFAPFGSSNVHSLGDVEAGGALKGDQSLIVNVTTNPGAYSLKISFTYMDENNKIFVDDQVITLLVYSIPLLEVNFYRDPGPLMAGNPNQLPLQVVNIGRKTAILGNMTVTTSAGELSNNTALIGTLESGGYYPVDAVLIPHQPGPLELNVTIDYTDDFNQPQRIEKTVTVEAIEGGPMGPGFEGPGGPEGPIIEPIPIEQPETAWQRFVRFLRGLLGLGSNQPEPSGPGEEMPPVEGIPPGEGQIDGPGEVIEEPIKVP